MILCTLEDVRDNRLEQSRPYHQHPNAVACCKNSSIPDTPTREQAPARRHPTSHRSRAVNRLSYKWLLVVFDFFELSVDDVVLVVRFFLGRLCTGFRLGALFGVHFLGHRRGDLGQLLNLGFDSGLVVAFDSGFQGNHGSFDRGFLFGGHFVTGVGDHLARRVHQGIALVAGTGQLFELAVFFGIELGITNHLLDFFIRQAGVGLDGDLLLFAGGLVLRADVQDAVGVDIESHFDLWHATWRWRNLGQVELAQGLVLRGLLALTLQDMDGHGALVVVGSREHLRFLGRNRGVFLDQRGHHATHGFDTQGQRADVEQQNVLHVTRQNGALDSSTHGNGFVRVDVFTSFFTEEVGDQFLYQRHAGLTADQDHVVDLGNVDTGVFQRDAARLDGALNQVFHQRFQLGAGDFHVQVLGTGGICGDVRQVDVGRLSRRQLDLGFFSGFFQALHGQRVTLEVHAAFFLELVDEVVDQTNVEVFTAEEGVTVGGQHFELVLAIDFGDFDHGHVEGTATQVINDDGVVATSLVHTVGQSGRGRFVDDALDIQTGDTTGVLGRLALAVVEVGRNGDDRFSDFFAEVVFGGFLHLFQDFSRDLWRCHFLAVHFNPSVAVVSLGDFVRNHLDVFLNDFFVELATDQTLHRVQCVMRIGHRLALGRLANQDFAIVGVGNDRRRGACTLGVFDHFGLAVFKNGDTGVGSPQVDTDNFAHFTLPKL